MSVTPDPASTPTQWRRLAARGEDAAGFLQGQLSQDLATREGSVETLLLTPSGDVVASMTVDVGEDGLDLILREESTERTIAALRRFLLRTRCVLEDVGPTPGPYATLAEQVAQFAPGPAEFASPLAPHSFGRGFVARHVSFSKGCFTGQELVGRLDVRGANTPFRVVRWRGDDLEAVAQWVAQGPSGDARRQGLTTTVTENGKFSGLAIVHRSALASVPSAVVVETPDDGPLAAG